MKLPSCLLLLVGSNFVNSQSFLSATGANPELSRFRQLITNQPDIANRLIARNRESNNQTVLVPNNDAFDNYFRNTGQNIESLQSSDLASLVDYHSLNGALSSSDLQQPMGLAARTGLTDPRYNNLGLQSNGAVDPQVVFVGSSLSSRLAQRQNPGGLFAQSGLVSNASINAIDAVWEGGLFHITDEFVPISLVTRKSVALLIEHL